MIEIREESPAGLDAYATVPIAFTVHRVLEVRVADGGLGGFVLEEREVSAPYVKDYDAAGNGPAGWPLRFDVARWGLLSAWIDGRRVGGAAVVADDERIEMLERRRDLAVLWDLRVAPDVRGAGVGSALLRAAEGWARSRGCRALKIETQNVNVAACRFYARHGAVLGAIHRFAYADCPDEAQLLWYKDIGR